MIHLYICLLFYFYTVYVNSFSSIRLSGSSTEHDKSACEVLIWSSLCLQCKHPSNSTELHCTVSTSLSAGPGSCIFRANQCSADMIAAT
jgi:hypothetical protein